MKIHVLAAMGALAVILGAAATARALDEIEVSGDVQIELGGVPLRAGEIARDDLRGSVTVSALASLLPPGVNIDAFERLPGGRDVLFSVDVSVEIGGRLARPADVVRYGASGADIVWSAQAAGLPPGADIDALARMPDGSLLLSFSTTLRLGAVTADDEDIVRVDPATGAVSMALDSSHLMPGTDIDAVDALADGSLMLSADVSDTSDGLIFSDEDVLIIDPDRGIALAYEGAALHPAWVAADLDALDGSLDPDGDGIADAADSCPFYVQRGAGDADGDGRGDECECTDQTGDGRNDVADLVAINAAIFNPLQITPLCDGNRDGACDVGDIVAANTEIFSPSNTSTCSRQPYPGP